MMMRIILYDKDDNEFIITILHQHHYHHYLYHSYTYYFYHHRYHFHNNLHNYYHITNTLARPVNDNESP